MFYTNDYSVLCNGFINRYTQSPSQIDGATEPVNMLIIIIVVIFAGIILLIVAVIACFLKRRKSSQQSSNREDKFQNPIFMGQRNEVLSGPSVGEYDQIPADKVTFVYWIILRKQFGGFFSKLSCVHILNGKKDFFK